MAEAAKLRPDEERLLRWLLRRTDALNFAYGALECEEWGYPETKAEMLDTLEEVRAEAHEWFESYRQALGVSDALDYNDDQGGVILRGAPPHDHEEESMEKHTVEYTFEAEEVSSVAGEYGDTCSQMNASARARLSYVRY